MAAKIKKGDRVVVLAGKDRGKSGQVLEVMPSKSRAVVQGINLVRRHQRQTPSQEAGIHTKPAPIHISNIALADPKENKPTRVGFTITDGVKKRVAKRSGEVIDG
jgi:large subunit ribosomal protein L24